MRCRGWLALAAVLALALILGEDASGGRGGRGGGGRGGFRGGGGGHGGGVVGPYGGGRPSYGSTGRVVGPSGSLRSAGSTSGSYTTKRGSTIDYAGAGRTATGPRGTTAGRGVGGVKVTTPGGQTAAKVGSAGGVKGPGGSAAVTGRSIGATTGPRGSGVSAARGGAAVGPSGAVAGGARAGTATGPAGRTVSGASHWGAEAGPYGAYASTRGAAVGAAGHYTGYRSAAAVRTQAGYVRAGFAGYHYFGRGWYAAHPGAWRAAAWATAGAFWAWASYPAVATFCGYPAEPVVYDYGSNLVYEDNRVYYNGEPVATAAEYASQAQNFAAEGQAAKASPKEEWKSLGVFAMVQGEEKDANNVFQLAINKEGVLRGNYYSTLTDAATPIYGSVDRKTQRAAWVVGENKETVYETGLGNLAQPETTMLVHFGTERTQQWTLVRLEPPKDKK
jgi:hypothetical protein